jgi:hypothetical protein
MLKTLPGIALILVLCSNLYATTWDEPWHRDVVAKSDAFGLYEVVSTSPTKVVFKEVRHLAGLQTGPIVELTGYYSRELMSSSTVNGVRDDESELRFKGPGTRYYLFLKKSSAGTTWTIASPTSGFAPVQPDGKVIGTFRISVHQALVDSDAYELAQICIFRKLHGEQCSPNVSTFIQAQLAAAPAVMSANASPEQADQFYKQHVALETAYLTGYVVDRETLLKFLKDSVVHTQISAVRALRASDSTERNAMLMSFVTDDSRHILARVVAVQMIREAGARELKEQIVAYAPKASSTGVGLGIEIMDPRVGTKFPSSLKAALEELIAEWK